jgi:DNA-binding protein H-NS
MDNEQLKRIADAMEEVIRLVKQDQEKFERYKKRLQKDGTNLKSGKIRKVFKQNE